MGVGKDVEDDSQPEDEDTQHFSDEANSRTQDETHQTQENGEPTLPVKDEKAEKKRLEKEKKEAEQKAKEEAKRLKKLEDQQKKDDEKQRKAIAKGENKTPSKIGSLFSPKSTTENSAKKGDKFTPSRAGVRPRDTVICRVLLLDGSDQEFKIEKHARGRELVEEVCKFLNLEEKDYFSCSYRDNTDIKFWLIDDRRIADQVGTGQWVFEFGVKFYPPEPTTLREDVTRYQLCLQIRLDIASGKLPCSTVTHALLGSYFCQSELGGYSRDEHGDGIEYLDGIQFAVNQTEDLLRTISDLHKGHGDMLPAEADSRYLDNAKKLGLYGVDLHPAKDSELIDIMVGVSASGVHIYRDGQKVNRFPWPRILKIAYKHKKFYLKIRAGEFERYENTIGFKLESHKLAKRLWRIAMEHHTFFRLKEPVKVQRSSFIDFGSKNRFSGRTHYQSRIYASTLTREPPYFERTMSRRLTGSRSMDHSSYSAARDDNKRSASMDFRSRPGYEEEQIGVVAGTGPDASRVAYVKTVRPGGKTPTYDTSHDNELYDKGSNNRDRNHSDRDQTGEDGQFSSFLSTPEDSENVRVKTTRTTVTTRVTNDSRSYDDENMPGYEEESPDGQTDRKKKKVPTASLR